MLPFRHGTSIASLSQHQLRLPLLDGESKSYRKNQIKQYITSNPSLQKILERKLQNKEINQIHKNTGSNLIPAKPKEKKHTHSTTTIINTTTNNNKLTEINN